MSQETHKLILVLNCGSSSLKGALLDSENGELVLSCLAEKLTTPEAYITFNYFENPKVQLVGRRSWFVNKVNGERHRVELTEKNDHTGAVEALLEELKAHDLQGLVVAIGHRVVHGGEKYSGSVLITDDVINTLEECIPLAPLHNPANLDGIRVAMEIFPDLPQVAVFDTAFHQTMPPRAFLYAIPYELYEQDRVRRYGFHGTSHRFVAGECARLLGRPLEGCNLITVHLGNGCSMTAIENGVSIDTSLGMTPLEGLVMGTRSGDVDPALHLFLKQNKGMELEAIDALLNKESGLKGLCGMNDMRDIHRAAEAGDRRAAIALEVQTYRNRKYLGAYMAVLGRVDAIVFTAGIGENDAVVRAESLRGLEHLGVVLDGGRNSERSREARCISSEASRVRVFVIPTNEELAIGRETVAVVRG